jgi:phage-related protein (TIGR01555 family)
MLKNWIGVRSQVTPEALDQLATAEAEIGLKASLLTGMRWGYLFGGAIGIILIEGQEGEMDKPLDLRTVLPGCFKGLYIVDRWCGVSPSSELVSNLSDPDLGLPDYYTIIASDLANQSPRVHHSRVVRFTGLKLPNYEERANMYWGESVIEPVYDELVKRDNVSSSIASLVFQAKVTTMAIKNLDVLFGGGDPKMIRDFWARMYGSAQLRNNFGTQVIGDEDKITQSQFSFSGLEGVYDGVISDLSGAAEIPVTRLFGRSATGLNATGEGDEKIYIDRVEGRQDAQLRPIINKLYRILMVSTWGKIPNDFKFKFNPIRSADIHDMARVAEFKGRTIVDTFKAGLTDQATAQKELREMSQDTGMFTDISDEMIENGRDVWTWDIAKRSDPLASMQYPSSGATSIASTVHPDDDPALWQKPGQPALPGVGSGNG